MTREQMQNELIQTFGHEHQVVIWFFNLCEQYPKTEWNDVCLLGIYESILRIDFYKNKLIEE